MWRLNQQLLLTQTMMTGKPVPESTKPGAGNLNALEFLNSSRKAYRLLSVFFLLALTGIGLYAAYWGRRVFLCENGSFVYAARLASEGKIPGIDFFNSYMWGFTYVYAFVLKVFGDNYLAPCLITIGINVLALAICMEIARKLESHAAALITGVLIIANPYLSLRLIASPQSEPLAMLCFAASSYFLISGVKKPLKYFTAISFMVFAAFTRIIFLPGLVFLLIYIALTASKRDFFLSLLLSILLVSLTFGLFAYLDFYMFLRICGINRLSALQPYWDTPGSWTEANPGYIKELLRLFTPAMVYCFIIVTYLIVKVKDPAFRRGFIKRNGILFYLLISISLITSLHFIPRKTFAQYHCLIYPVLSILIGIASARILPDRKTPGIRRCLTLSLPLILLPVWFWAPRYLAPKEHSYFYELKQIASYIRKSSSKEDLLLTNYMPIAVEAGRHVVPHTTRGTWSLTGLPEDAARRLLLMNPDMLKKILASQTPRFVVLRDIDAIYWLQMNEFRSFLVGTLLRYYRQTRVYPLDHSEVKIFERREPAAPDP